MSDLINFIKFILEYIPLKSIITSVIFIIGAVITAKNIKKQNKYAKRAILWDKVFAESCAIRYHIEQLRFKLKFENQNFLEDLFSDSDIKTKMLICERNEKFLLGLGIGFDIITMFMPYQEFENYFVLSKQSFELKEPFYLFRSSGRNYRIFNKNIQNYAAKQNKQLIEAINEYYSLKAKDQFTQNDKNRAIELLDEINSYLGDFTMIFRIFLIGVGKAL